MDVMLLLLKVSGTSSRSRRSAPDEPDEGQHLGILEDQEQMMRKNKQFPVEPKQQTAIRTANNTFA